MPRAACRGRRATKWRVNEVACRGRRADESGVPTKAACQRKWRADEDEGSYDDGVVLGRRTAHVFSAAATWGSALLSWLSGPETVTPCWPRQLMYAWFAP